MEKEKILNKLTNLIGKFNQNGELETEFIQELAKLINDELQEVLEDHNFKINSDGWKKITVNDKEYLENPEKIFGKFWEKKPEANNYSLGNQQCEKLKKQIKECRLTKSFQNS